MGSTWRSKPSGTQGTFESALRVLRPGGRLSSPGGVIPVTCTFLTPSVGLGDYSIVSTLCPGGRSACAA